MKHLTDKRSSTSVLLMLNVARINGITQQQCLENTGITEEMLADTGLEIHPDQELKLIKNLQRLQPHEAFAVEIGCHYHLATYGILGFAISTSPTVRSAVEVALSYLPLTFAFCTFAMQEENKLGYMKVDARQVPEEIRRFVVERDMAAMLCMYRETFGQMMPLEGLEFQWSASDDATIYQHIYAKSPSFNQAENQVIFNRLLLDLPLPTANEQSRKMLVAQCQDLLQKRHTENSTALKVRNHILANIDHNITMDDIADNLCVSLRTLRRQLTDEGTSFRTLNDEVKESLAMQLIQETQLTMEQISIRLGYSDSANFFHAFKRWTGNTPNHYRV